MLHSSTIFIFSLCLFISASCVTTVDTDRGPQAAPAAVNTGAQSAPTETAPPGAMVKKRTGPGGVTSTQKPCGTRDGGASSTREPRPSVEVGVQRDIKGRSGVHPYTHYECDDE